MIAALLAAAAIAGCGGDSNEALSYDALGDEVGRICVDTTSAIEDATGTPPGDSEELVDNLTKADAVIGDALGDTKALDPPEELQAAFDEYVAAFEVQRAGFADALEAAKADDAAAYKRAIQAFAQTDSQEAASKLGADACLT